MPRAAPTALWIAAALGAVAQSFGAAAADHEPGHGSISCRGPAAITDIGHDGRIGAKWNAATQTLAYGRPQKDGHYRTFVADRDGSGERRIAFSAWRDDRHQFPAAWHPAGELLAMLVEQDDHASVDAIPGYGAYTDYWIVTRDGGRARKLYALPAGYDHAITHAALSPDGSKFVWTERVAAEREFMKASQQARLRPWLLWSVLIAGVGVLAALVWRLARTGAAPSPPA